MCLESWYLFLLWLFLGALTPATAISYHNDPFKKQPPQQHWKSLPWEKKENKPQTKKTLTNSAAGSRNPSQRHIPAINKLMIFRKLINWWWCWGFCSNSGKSTSWSSMDGKLQGQGPLSSLPWFLFCALAAESWGIHVSGTVLAKT